MRRWFALLAVALAGFGCAGPRADTDAGSSDESSTSFETGFESESESESGEPAPDLPSTEHDDCDRLLELLDALAAEPDPANQAALIDTFIRTVSYGEGGFPITEAGKLAIVYRGPPNQALSLAGDFNGWDPSAAPLLETVPGFYHVILELAEPATGLYKLVRDQVEFFADPLARRFGWDEFGEYSQIDALPERGHHERWPLFDQAAGELEPRALTVYLPAGTDAGPTLPVLYMHDGQNLFAPDALFGGWQVSATVEQAISDAVIDPLIIVGIDNTAARFDEYTHVSDVIEGTEYGGRASEYAAFLVDGIMPFVESRYPAASEPERVGVMGSSLGGLVSLYIGLNYSEEFGYVGSMSGTIAWGSLGANNPTILDLYVNEDPPPLGLRIYLDSGGSEGLGCPDDGSDNYCGNVDMANALRSLGWVDEDDLFYRWTPDAPHNEAAWADRLLPALSDWFID